MSLAQNIKKTINYSRKNGYGEAVVAAWERVTAKYYADYTYRVPDAGTLERQRAETQASELKFSILVPAYETQRVYMEALIESCIGQSYENWELVIADGSATEVVQKTVDRYQDARIRYVKLEENLGIAENTNRAIQLATGCFSDRWEPLSTLLLAVFDRSLWGENIPPLCLPASTDGLRASSGVACHFRQVAPPVTYLCLRI